MWGICLSLALLCIHPLNAQYDDYITNSREGRGRVANAVNTTNYDSTLNMPRYATNNNNNNAIVYVTQLSDRKYNKNSRDSFGHTDTLEESLLFSHGKEMQFEKNQNNETGGTKYDSSTTFPIFNENYLTPQSRRRRDIPTTNSFNARLFDLMSTNAQNVNLVYSPISLQTLLAFIFTMSEGQLYEELAQLLAISNNRTLVAKIYENLLQKTLSATQATTLIMANKLFYDSRFGPIDYSVRNFAKKSFDSEIEPINFFESKRAANTINSWISMKTRNLITDIVSPSSISGDTNALLLNSIYFKSEWLTKFATDDTQLQDFFMTKQHKIPVFMMYNEDVFRYGDFSEDLHASVVELPYKNSNISMLLILPQHIDGLSSLERNLRNYDLQTISEKLKREIVTVKLPKFKIGYEMNMIETLQEMGVNALFNNAGRINLFKNQQKPLKIDQFKHKSVIDVNESGTEASAATVAKYVPLSLPTDMKYFIADHPFVFVIRDGANTFFMGHLVKF